MLYMEPMGLPIDVLVALTKGFLPLLAPKKGIFTK